MWISSICQDFIRLRRHSWKKEKMRNWVGCRKTGIRWNLLTRAKEKCLQSGDEVSWFLQLSHLVAMYHFMGAACSHDKQVLIYLQHVFSLNLTHWASKCERQQRVHSPGLPSLFVAFAPFFCWCVDYHNYWCGNYRFSKASSKFPRAIDKCSSKTKQQDREATQRDPFEILP